MNRKRQQCTSSEEEDSWFGHVTRKDDRRLQAAALYGYVDGTGSPGRRTKTWVDNVNEDLRAQGMGIRDAIDKTRNRTM